MKKAIVFLVIVFAAIYSNAQVKVYAKFVPTSNLYTMVDENPGTTHSGQILLTTVSSSEVNKTSIGLAGGTGGSKVRFDSLIFSKPVSVNSPTFFYLMSINMHYKYVEVSYYNAADQIIYRQTLGTVFTIGAARTAASCSSGCPGIIENITMAYGVEIFTFYTTPGNLSTGVSKGWDQIRNVAANNPAAITQ